MNKTPSPFSRNRKDPESGLALILVIGILTILLMVGLTMVNVMRVEEKSADDFYIKLGARYFSKSGFDHAVNTLKRDVDESTLSPEYDVVGTSTGADDCWHAAFYESNPGTTPAYLVTQVAPDKYEDDYSRWLYVKRDQTGFIVLDDYNFAEPRTGVLNQARYGTAGSTTVGNYEIIGRYAILVKDEAGKINVNAAGDGTYAGTRGENPVELRMDSVLSNIHRATNPARQVDATVASDIAADIVNWRYGANDATTTKDAGTDSSDDDASNAWMENDYIDNNASGTVDEVNEGVDDPDEFNPDLPFPDAASSTKRDKPIDTIYDLLLIPSFSDVTSVQNGGIPTTSQSLMNAISPYITANSRDYNQFCCINGAGTVSWHNKISLNAMLDAQKIYDEIDDSNFLCYSPSADLYNDLRHTCANIADAFDFDLFPTHIADHAGSAQYWGLESVRINEIGKFSGYVKHGQPVTSPGGNWVANGNMIRCPDTALESANYTISLPSTGSAISYVVYFKTGPANAGLKITLEPGTGYETILQLDSPNSFVGTTQTVTADGTLNITITNTNASASQVLSELEYTIVTARYIELINLSERSISVAGWRFSVDGGTNYYYIPSTSTATIPAADYSTGINDVARYGYLVLATNLYAFETTWENTLDGALDDEYAGVCGSKTTTLVNTNYTDSSASAISMTDDWGIVPGAAPLGGASTGNIIVQAPVVANPTLGTNAHYGTIAWATMTSSTTNNKVGWMTDPGLSTAEYEENSRECVSAASDESPWRISQNTRFAASVSGEINGSPGALNDNTVTSGLVGGGSELLWKVPSVPVGNLGFLADVTIAAQINATLFYSNSWMIDLTPFFTVDQHLFDSGKASQTGAWALTTPDGSTSTPYVYPYKTTYLRGSSANLLSWQVENASGVYSFIPPIGEYSLFIAGSYMINPLFDIDGATRTLNASNLYSVTGAAAGSTTPCGSSSVMDLTDRTFSFQIEASSNFDFDYAILAPTKYTYGKINVNTATTPVLQALTFTGALTSTDIGNIIGSTNKPYLSPGDVVRAFTGTDDQRREKWKKISRYITVRSDTFEIIVVGETIRDQTLGNDFDVANDKVSASDRIIGIVDRGEYRKDPSLGKVKVLHLHTE